MTACNAVGRQVHVYANEHQEAGYKSVIWAGRDDAGREVRSGIYIVRLNVNRQSLIEMVTLQQ